MHICFILQSGGTIIVPDVADFSATLREVERHHGEIAEHWEITKEDRY